MTLYDFRLRFNLAEGYRIHSDADKIDLFTSPSGERIVLKGKVSGKPIKDYAEAAIIGKSYISKAEAKEAAEKARRAFLVWAIESRLGIDFGDGKPKSLVTKEGLALMQKQSIYPVRNDIHGIDVYEHNEHTIFVKTEARATVGKAPPKLVETFQHEYSIFRKIPEKLLLACEIYTSSFFDVTPRSRFITLVTAVEALLVLKKRDKAAKALIADFIYKINHSKLSKTTKESLVGSLGHLKNQSILQAGRLLVHRLLPNESFNGQSSDDFFTYCYDIRSQVLHNGKPFEKSIDIRQLANTMEQFVVRLLINSLHSG